MCHKVFRRNKESAAGKMYTTVRLAVDPNGCILVTDMDNSRVLLLSASVDFIRELTPRRDFTKWWRPNRLCQDEQHEMLYICENEWNGETFIAGQLVAYKVKFSSWIGDNLN